ncbi:MAG: Lrp/AsnC family transcriptional regulator [Pseudomonadota bacterium]
MTVTEKDRQVIDLLRANARMTVSDIAAHLGVSRSTAQKRLEKLEADDVIRGYTVVMSPDYLAREVRAHASIVVQPKMTEAVIEAMSAIDTVREIHSVSGAYDLIAVIVASSVTELDRSIDRLIAIEGIERTMSSVILSTRLMR